MGVGDDSEPTTREEPSAVLSLAIWQAIALACQLHEPGEHWPTVSLKLGAKRAGCKSPRAQRQPPGAWDAEAADIVVGTNLRAMDRFEVQI